MANIEYLSGKTAKDGFTELEDRFVCIYCGQEFEKGEIFKVQDRFFDAQKMARIHAENHDDRLERIFEMGGKNLSLTDNQKKLISLFADGMSDSDIAKELGITPSTVRHQRFMFRERAKGARAFLALWELAENGKNNSRSKSEDNLITPHEGAKMVDERYVITEQEEKNILENVFISLEPLKQKVFSKKEKKKIVILRKVAQQFEAGKQYTEPEVNDILQDIWHDYATMRRYLIEYGYLDRSKDCKSYWKKA